MTRAHVIGAGLAGLGAAVALVREGFAVTLYEATGQAGGRCRSYHDPQLGMTIDNGNHLVLAGNAAVHAYLATIGAADRLTGPSEARFPFIDLADCRRWEIHPNAGRLPWWIAVPNRRVPGTRLRDYVALARLRDPAAGARVGDILSPRGPLWNGLVEPFLLAALNSPPASASALLAGTVLREALMKGGRASRPRIATPALSAAFVDPALAWLEARDVTIRLNHRLRAIAHDGRHVTALDFGDGEDRIAAEEPVILAVPPWVAAALVHGLVVPDVHHAIVNAHFRIAPPPGAAPMIGVLGATSEWIFAFPDRLSVTISAADRLCDEDRETLAARLWQEVARVHALPDRLPPWQIVREKRATFAATPEQDAKRPPAATGWRNLILAGDWTQTGLPATIEGALRSAATAARLATERRG